MGDQGGSFDVDEFILLSFNNSNGGWHIIYIYVSKRFEILKNFKFKKFKLC